MLKNFFKIQFSDCIGFFLLQSVYQGKPTSTEQRQERYILPDVYDPIIDRNIRKVKSSHTAGKG